jgi:hypothetical protein
MSYGHQHVTSVVPHCEGNVHMLALANKLSTCYLVTCCCGCHPSPPFLPSQAKVTGETSAPAADTTAADAAAKEEVDARSVYVGNVDYGCTPEELQLQFQVLASDPKT